MRALFEAGEFNTIRSLAHALPTWFWETDEKFNTTYVSENVRVETGLDPDGLIGVNILDPQYGRSETEGGLGDFQGMLRRQLPIERLSYERVLPTGERVNLLDSALPKFDFEGNFQGYCGMTIHLSRAMQAAQDNGSLLSTLQSRNAALEEALSQRNADLAASNKLRSEILEALGEGLLVTSHADLLHPDNTVRFFNPAYQRIMDLEDRAIYPGMPFTELAQIAAERGDVTDDKVDEIEAAVQTGEVFELQLGNSNRNIEVKCLQRPDGGMVLVHKDVTQLRARTKMLEDARQEAEEANAAKSTFLATMSHEIRTPMNGIAGVADLLAETELDAEQREYVDTIRRSAAALTDLIGDILDFSKIEAGRLALADEPFDLLELAQDVHLAMLAIAQNKGIELLLKCDPALPSVVRGDRQRLRQVLVNLLGNAVKFTLEGQVQFELRKGHEDRVEVLVSDTGIGIPKEKLTSIFGSFEQVQTGLHRQFEGTGLGLAITQSLICSMNGEIKVSSAEHEGTTFLASIPLPATDTVLAPPRAPEATVPLSFSVCRVLLAEDNKTNQFVARKMLERHGIDAEMVSNGKEACDRTSAEAFDLVLMDLSMPEMSGLEATRRIREVERRLGHKPVKIVALTGNAFESDRQACFDAGMDGFLTKPIRMTDLSNCLQSFLGRSEQTSGRRSA